MIQETFTPPINDMKTCPPRFGMREQVPRLASPVDLRLTGAALDGLHRQKYGSVETRSKKITVAVVQTALKWCIGFSLVPSQVRLV